MEVWRGPVNYDVELMFSALKFTTFERFEVNENYALSSLFSLAGGGGQRNKR